MIVHDGRFIPKFPTVKDPGAVKDYYVPFGDWLASGETIESRTVSATNFDVDSSSLSASLTIDGRVYHHVVTVWLSGGTAGTTGTVTVRVTTSAGRTEYRSFHLDCNPT